MTMKCPTVWNYDLLKFRVCINKIISSKAKVLIFVGKIFYRKLSAKKNLSPLNSFKNHTFSFIYVSYHTTVGSHKHKNISTYQSEHAYINNNKMTLQVAEVDQPSLHSKWLELLAVSSSEKLTHYLLKLPAYQWKNDLSHYLQLSQYMYCMWDEHTSLTLSTICRCIFKCICSVCREMKQTTKIFNTVTLKQN